MTAGVLVPLDMELIEDAIVDTPQLLRKVPEEAIDDRRFAEAIYRVRACERDDGAGRLPRHDCRSRLTLECRSHARLAPSSWQVCARDHPVAPLIACIDVLSGIVILTNDRRDKAPTQSRSCRRGDLAPRLHGRGSKCPARLG